MIACLRTVRSLSIHSDYGHPRFDLQVLQALLKILRSIEIQVPLMHVGETRDNEPVPPSSVAPLDIRSVFGILAHFSELTTLVLTGAHLNHGPRIGIDSSRQS